MITSTTQAAVAAFITAVKTDFNSETVKNINVNITRMEDGSNGVNISVGIPVTNTSPAANGQVSISYVIATAE